MSVVRAERQSPPRLDIKLLGRFEVLRDGEPLSEAAWGRRKTKTLLKVLLTAPGTVFSKDQLIDALFGGENVRQSTKNLYGRVSQLRRALEPTLERGTESSYIQRSGPGYLFNSEAGARLDILDFQQGIEQAQNLARSDAWEAAANAFERALDLYCGEFLPEERYEDWAQTPRSDLACLCLDSVSSLAECYEHLGRLRQAISCCRRILAAEPQREDILRLLMRLQSDAGQDEQALGSFRDGALALRDYLDVEPSAETRSLRDQIQRSRAMKPKQDSRRIAVLPLQNFSPEAEDAYIADGMTEELIGSIARIGDLRVIARTSVMRFKNTTRSIASIARDLGVGTILEGSVRKVGDHLRISAQLINATADEHLWAEHYDLELGDVLEVQAQIARRVSEALRLKLLAGEEKALHVTEAANSAAHIAYLKGRHFLEKPSHEAVDTAIGYFEEALNLEPKNARALTGLADAYCRRVLQTSAAEAYPKAKAYAEQALALDPTLAEAHCCLARIVLGRDRDVESAERLLRRAVELDPNCAHAHALLADLLAATDHVDEAIEMSQTALALNPLSAPLTLEYANCLYHAARFHEAIEQAEKAIELDGDLPAALWVLWYSIGATWDWERAEKVLRATVDKHPENPHAYIYLAMCVQCRGRLEEGVSLMEQALALPGAAEDWDVIFYSGNACYFAGDFDRADSFYRRVLNRQPTVDGARVLLAKCHVHRGRFQDALAELDAVENKYGMIGDYWLTHVRMERGRIHALQGDRAKAEKELAQLMAGTGRQNRRMAISVILFVLGRVDEAFHWAEESVNAREPHVNAFRKAPEFPSEMRSDPRFQALLKRIGLDD